MTEQQPEAPAVPGDQCAAKPECEHYFHSLCYRGVSVRICQLCHEPDWDDLVAQLADRTADAEDELAAAAERERMAALDVYATGCGSGWPCAAREKLEAVTPAPVPAEPVVAATVTLRGSWRERIIAALDASIDRCARCKTCDQQVDAVLTAIMPLSEIESALDWGTSCVSCGKILDRANIERERAERAEAKLAAIKAHCLAHPEFVRLGGFDSVIPPASLVKVTDILAIIGTEGKDDHAR